MDKKGINKLSECLTDLKKMVSQQGNDIVKLSTDMSYTKEGLDNLRTDVKKIFDKLEKFNIEVVSVKNWQKNYEKNENKKIALATVAIGFFNIMVSSILVLGLK